MMKAKLDDWEEDEEEIENFSIKDSIQLNKTLINAYISGKKEFQLKFTGFSSILHQNLTETLKKLPGFEIFHMTHQKILIKDLGDIESLKSLDEHNLCQQRLKALAGREV